MIESMEYGMCLFLFLFVPFPLFPLSGIHPVPLEGKRETIDGWIPGEKREKKRKKRPNFHLMFNVII